MTSLGISDGSLTRMHPMLEDEQMKLSESEMQEFTALAQNTYDPEIFTEEDLPALREAKRRWEEEQGIASPVLPADQPAWADEEDDGAEAHKQGGGLGVDPPAAFWEATSGQPTNRGC